MKEINVGLIGYKFMGKMHSNAYQRIKMFFDPSIKINMKAICGRNEENVKKAAKNYGWESYETDWKKLVEREDIDLIDITTPTNYHKEMVIAAAQAGKHVLCEKPLAGSEEDAREMLEAVEKNNVKHMVIFNNRFAPAVQLAKEFIKEDKIGTIYHVRASWLQDYLIDPKFPLVWRLQKEMAGSGSIGDLGAHIIDITRFLVGEFDSVMGMSKTFIKQRPIVEKMDGLSASSAENSPQGEVTVDDATVFMAQFKDEVAIGQFEATRYANGHRNKMSFEINGSKGSLYYDLERMDELHYFSSEDEAGTQGFRLIQATEGNHPYMKYWWPAGHIIGYEHTFVHQIYEFIEDIAHDRITNPNFKDGLKNCQIIDSVINSAETGQWTKVD